MVPTSRPCSAADEPRPDARFSCGLKVYLGCAFEESSMLEELFPFDARTQFYRSIERL